MAAAATFTLAGQNFPRAGTCGREKDLARWVEQHRQKLYRMALRQLHDPDEAQDAVQDALLSAYRHLDQFQGRAELGTWLTRIVINAARQRQRQAATHPSVSLDALPAAGEFFPDRGLSPEAECARHERHRRLYVLLRRLSPPLRAAVALYELEGMSCRQAAARLGIKPATLKCRLFRGRARLAELTRRPRV